MIDFFVVSLVLLGSVDVPADSAVPSVADQFGSPRLRCLLAALSLRANAFAPTDWLIEILWPTDEPATPDAALHNLVFRLRSRLRDRGADQRLRIVTRAGGYALIAERTEIDTLLFTDRIREGCALLDHDPRAAIDILDAARDLWTGAPFGEFADRDWARSDVDELSELRLNGIEATADALVAIGSPADAVIRLGPVADAEPYREGLHRRLMDALWRDDRRAAALETYQQLRQRLSADLGTDPAPTVQRLHAMILAGAPTPPDTAHPRIDRPVPRPATMLVGRRDDLADLARQTAAGRCVTVVGPGGVGKTALVRAYVAGLRRESVRWADLAAVTTPDAVTHAVIAASGATPRRDAEPIEALIDAFGGRRGLLVLDNCEHVVDAAARLADRLVADAPGLAIVATSRTPLGISVEQVVPIEPLPVPPVRSTGTAASSTESVQLFMIRAAARNSRWAPSDDDIAAVAEICRRLDGLPLAIELAAATSAAISPSALVDRLQWRFRVLRGPRDADPRHRSLQALIDWSYGLLDPAAAALFDIVAIFPSQFALDDAEDLAASTGRVDPTQVAAAVVALVDASMLSVTGAGYRMLETLRDYGINRLDTAGALADSRRAHVRTVAERIAPLATELYAPGQAHAAAAVAERFDDLRQAITYAVDSGSVDDLALADEILCGVIPFLELTMSSEVAGWARRVREAHQRPGQSADAGASAWAVSAACARFDGDLAAAQQWTEIGLTRAPSLPVTVYLRLMRVEVALFRGDLGDALAHAADLRSASIAAGMSGAGHMAEAMTVLLSAYRSAPEDPDRRECHSAAISLDQTCTAAGETGVAAWCRYIAAECIFDEEPDLARRLFDSAIDAAREHGDRYLLGVSLTSRASVETRHGDIVSAATYLADTVAHWRDAGNWTHQWVSLRAVISVLAHTERARTAAILLGAVRNTVQATGPDALGDDATRLADYECALRDRLGDRVTDDLMSHGSRMARAELIDLVITELRTVAER
ncbi:BTAD domain-containing putative transcriptional regulator [Gordonia sp. CPCC 205515]|uniref:BTAD domain-containing putative transcriptional regulator n=1 Tax=Gordonia sp. CPCC 205515 TaxID=3140791 RepID=UPI003AF4048E